MTPPDRELESTRKALDSLKATLRMDEDVARDDPLWLRIADIEIDLEALEATAARAVATGASTIDPMIALAAPALDRRLAELASDLLAWYSLPAQTRGDNEPPVTHHHLRALAGDLLRRGLVDETERLRLVNELAELLARWQIDRPGGDHERG